MNGGEAEVKSPQGFILYRIWYGNRLSMLATRRKTNYPLFCRIANRQVYSEKLGRLGEHDTKDNEGIALWHKLRNEKAVSKGVMG